MYVDGAGICAGSLDMRIKLAVEALAAATTPPMIPCSSHHGLASELFLGCVRPVSTYLSFLTYVISPILDSGLTVLCAGACTRPNGSNLVPLSCEGKQHRVPPASSAGSIAQHVHTFVVLPSLDLPIVHEKQQGDSPGAQASIVWPSRWNLFAVAKNPTSTNW